VQIGEGYVSFPGNNTETSVLVILLSKIFTARGYTKNGLYVRKAWFIPTAAQNNLDQFGELQKEFLERLFL